MKNLKKLALTLILGFSIFAPTFPAEHQIALDEISSSQGLFATLCSAVESSPIYNTIQSATCWVKDNPIKTMRSLGVLSLGYKAFTYYHRDSRTVDPLATLLHDPLTSLKDLHRINDQFESIFKTEKLDKFDHPDERALEKLTSLIQSHE